MYYFGKKKKTKDSDVLLVLNNFSVIQWSQIIIGIIFKGQKLTNVSLKGSKRKRKIFLNE